MITTLHAKVIRATMVLAALGWTMLWAQAGPVEERVTVKNIVGKAEVKSAASPQWRAVRVNMPVKAGWDVRTFVESSLELQYESGTIIRIGENSVVTLAKMIKDSKESAGDAHIKIATGEVWGNVQKLMNKKSNFSFETPTAVASIRGTVKRSVSRGGRDTIECMEGSVVVTNKGSRRSVTLTDKQRAVLEKGSNEINVTTIETSSMPSSGSAASGELTLTIESPQSGAIVEETPITIKGKTKAGAVVVVGELKATAADDGSFSLSAELAPGTNNISVTATLGQNSANARISLEYKPKLIMTVKNITNNMEVATDELAAEVEVSEGATVGFMLNKQATENPLKLKPGNNVLTVTATDPWGGSLVQEFTIKYKKGAALFVTVTSPSDGASVTSATVEVSGTTVPGATVTVNDMTASVNESGLFRHSLTLQGAGPEYEITVKAAYDGQEVSEEISVTMVSGLDLQIMQPANGQKLDTTIFKLVGTITPGATLTADGKSIAVMNGNFNEVIHIPDESGEFTLELVGELRGMEITKEVTVIYEPMRTPLILEVTSPRDNEIIEASPIKVAGRTSPHSTVMVSGRRASVAPDGRFTADIVVMEQNVGDFQIEVSASDESDEMSKTIDVVIGIKSPKINTSVPQLTVSGQSTRASRIGEIAVQVLDRTPGDEITLMSALNGGSPDEYAMQPNSSERLKLDEGKNVYEVKARDLAGNMSNVVRGERYYLPGPLEIDIIEPPVNPYIIDDLPPMPRGVSAIETEIEVEIEDQVGNVPETILYVKARGADQDIQLQKNPNYIYSGKLRLNRGTNLFTIEVEDIAGNRKSKTLTIRIEE